jgi:hypothetical protein
VWTSFADVDNRIGWLLNQDQSTPDARAAVQLAIWYTVDNKPDGALNGFSMSTGDSTITNDYNGLISFSGYNPAQNYAAQFWQATHDPGNGLYQDLVSTVGGNIHINSVPVASVPEPSSLALGGCGVAFLISAVVRRRLRRAQSAR